MTQTGFLSGLLRSTFDTEIKKYLFIMRQFKWFKYISSIKNVAQRYDFYDLYALLTAFG